MDWENVFTVIMAVLVSIGLPLALRSRKKLGPKKRQELYEHLKQIGLNVAMTEKANDAGKIGVKSSWMQKSQGIINVGNKNIEIINVIGVSSEYGTHYFLDYLVRCFNLQGMKLKKTKLRKKKKITSGGKVSVVEWTGDKPLSQNLNFDGFLKNTLTRTQFTGSIEIVPEPKSNYTRIRTNYFLPSSEFFEVLDIIAGYIKSRY